MEPAVIWAEAYTEHDTGDHPESASRVADIVAHLRIAPLSSRLQWAAPEPAALEDILRVHTAAHIALVRDVSARGGRWLDPDTYVSRRSYATALLAAGGAIEATRLWEVGLCSFALVRPPGHHALAERSMGFCLFNNVAVAAARLLAEGFERVAVLDWDVHHGNGTQAAFLADPRVLFVSLHQWPHFPGTGDFHECGEGAGEGTTVNLPLPAGCTDGDYAHAFGALVEPIVRQFRPQAVLVSAGQDIHRDDPFGDMLVTEAGFADMAKRCAGLADELCGGRLAFVLEGGYDHGANARSVEAALSAVAGDPVPPVGAGSPGGAAAVARALAAQAAYWRL